MKKTIIAHLFDSNPFPVNHIDTSMMNTGRPLSMYTFVNVQNIFIISLYSFT